jgi:hypothetical protein
VPMALHDRGKEEVRAKMGDRKGSDAVGVRNCGGTYRGRQIWRQVIVEEGWRQQWSERADMLTAHRSWDVYDLI